jgi:tetratricopeptide (TPR) repeat protein
LTDIITKYKAFAARLVRDPDDPEALVEQFALLSGQGDKTKNHHYLSLAKRAYEVQPKHLSTVFNYACAMERTGQFENALKLYDECLPLAEPPDMAQLLHDIGVSHRGLGDNTTAIKFYDEAIKLNPSPFFKRDRAIAMMAGATMGTHRFTEALEAFESRRECAEAKFKTDKSLTSQKRLPPNVVHWKGEDLKGKSVVVYHEEGTGDFIQFSRFIPRLYDLGVSSIKLTGPHPDLLEMIDKNISTDGVVPLLGFNCDYVVGSMTLPWRLCIEYKDLDGKPYIEAEPAFIPKRGNLNVGLVWQGSPIYLRNHLRSMPLETMAPLFGTAGIAFHSLQIGHEKDITNLGLDGFIADLTPFMKNWSQTARVISALDVVVSVDTAVAHLAGAMGKPVFIMVTRGCDWRWNRDSAITPWYSSARVFRQQRQGDWSPCIEAVKQQLDEMNGRGRQITEGIVPSSPGGSVAAG